MMRSPNWSSKILKEETVTSTNDRLAELCQEKKIKEFTTLMAEYQTAGKGQRGNSWESEYGKNLTFSTVFYPQTIAPASQFILSMAVASAICTALAHYVHADCLQIKWPNDIYWKDKKIAGILIENDLTGSQISQSIIGIGININQEEFHSSAPNPVSLRQITQKETDRMEVLNSVLAHIIASLFPDRKQRNRYHYQNSGILPESTIPQGRLSPLLRCKRRVYCQTDPCGARRTFNSER